MTFNTNVEKFLNRRVGTVEVAFENMNTGVIYSFGSRTPQNEASVVKVNILATLLSRSTTGLSEQERALAQAMIEESDNQAATSLWDAAGARAGIARFDASIGLTATTPSSCVNCPNFPWPGWGLTTTTPLDELRLLRAVLFDPTFLTSADRAYELRLMESVVPSERWGVSAGIPSTATVALKNGWLPLNTDDTDWQINSVGWIRGDSRDYIVALFSTGNPSEEYGIQTLDALSTRIWQYLST